MDPHNETPGEGHALASVPRFRRSATAAEVAHALDAHGCAVIEELLPPELCEQVEAELRPWMNRTPPGADDFTGRNTRRTGALLARSPTAVQLVAHQLVLDVADKVLGRSKTAFQLHVTQAIAIEPGAPAQALHRDQWCFDFFDFPTDINVEVSTIWALCDFTADNGATRVVPNSHRTKGMPYRDRDAVAVEMPQGSVVLYTGATVHGGGANRTDTSRLGVNVDYTLGWLRQEENQYLSVPQEIAAALPEQVQRLMGYAKGGYALGYVDDVRDPITILCPDRPSASTFLPS